MTIYLNDKTANGNNLTNSGAAESSNTPFGSSTYSADLEASESDYLVITDANQTGLDLTTALTIEFWIKPESYQGIEKIVHFVSKSAAGGKSYAVVNYQGNASQYFGLWIGDASTQDQFTAYSHQPTTGEWHHYAVTWDGSNKHCEIYRDGSSVSSQVGSNVSSIADTSYDLMIGARGDGDTTTYHDGLIDEIRIWNDVRTPTEISQNYNHELRGNEANLVAYWPFEIRTTTGTGFVTTFM
jgi:hypothetical protein